MNYNIKFESGYIEIESNGKLLQRFYCPVKVLYTDSKCGKDRTFTLCDFKNDKFIFDYKDVKFIDGSAYVADKDDILNRLDEWIKMCEPDNLLAAPTEWVCRKSDETMVPVTSCKVQGVIQFTDNQSGATMNGVDYATNYCNVCPEKECGCELATYTMGSGETITNATLLAHANASATLTGALGGLAQGISALVFVLDDDKSLTDEDARFKLNDLNWVDVDTLDVRSFGDAEVFEDFGQIEIESNKGTIELQYTVYRCA